MNTTDRPTTAARSGQGRPRVRRRRAEQILDALEKLLESTPLSQLGVEQIAEAAGITRTRFYFYYNSKHLAYAALLERIGNEVGAAYQSPDSWFNRAPGQRPRAAFEATFRQILTVWFEHRAVLREASDLWNAPPEVRDQWLRLFGGLVDIAAATIERERALGVAPPGPDARRLAESMIWSGERLQFLMFIEAPNAMTIEELVDVGTAVWIRGIYRSDDPSPRPRKASMKR
jgi:AcrR family transcriptional regulator